MSFLNIKWSPKDYVDASVVANEAAEGLLARLSWMTLKPLFILDLGCGTGEMAKHLQMHYPQAQVIALDRAEAMLMHAKTHTPASLHYLCADSAFLPFADHTIDLVVANFLIPWQYDISALLKECKRVLKPDGLIMLSALGPDTLQVWRDALGDEHFPQLIDMHHIGDALLQQGFADPVLDVDYFTIIYSNQEKLAHELKASGMLTENVDQNKLATVIANDDGKWHLTYEVIFAHAFLPKISDEFSVSASGEVRVPISHLRRKLHEKE